MGRLKRSQVERLFSYYHYLLQHHEGGEANSVSSAELAEFLEIDATQVRKDLAAVGVRGCPRVGYPTKNVIRTIASRIGLGAKHNAVIVGAGRLGGAVAEYSGFTSYGVNFVALFDDDPHKQGAEVGGCPVYPMGKLGPVVRRHQAKLGVITVPDTAAQEVATTLVEAGIQSIWNFAHTQLTVPRDVWVRHEHISTGLAELIYHLKQPRRRRTAAAAAAPR
jgi:redox-sensing transcriptional repressor